MSRYPNEIEIIDEEFARMRENCSNDENSVVSAFVGGEIVGLAEF